MPDMTEQTQGPVSERPNVLVIVADDQRADTLVVMPFTRGAFSTGVEYRKAYATTPLCGPSRATILSGQYAHNHRVLKNAQGDTFDHSRSVQKPLKESGYATAYVGKYINSWPIGRPLPYIDWFATFEPNKAYYRQVWNINGSTHTESSYTVNYAGAQSRAAVDFLATTGKPWFLVFAPYACHAPYVPHPSHRDDPVPARPEGFKDQIRVLLTMDEEVGRLFDHLASLSEDENLLAFYVSDNGYMWGERGLQRKRWPYGPSAKIPYLMRDPASSHGVSHDIVGTIDMVPTILEAAGMTNDVVKRNGRSLLAGGPSRPHLLLEYWRENPSDGTPTWRSVVGPLWQYIEWSDKSFGHNGIEKIGSVPSNAARILRDLAAS
jgi:arylsulfatase A-like enzyme